MVSVCDTTGLKPTKLLLVIDNTYHPGCGDSVAQSIDSIEHAAWPRDNVQNVEAIVSVVWPGSPWPAQPFPKQILNSYLEGNVNWVIFCESLHLF